MRAALGALLGIPAEKIAKATLPPPPVPRAPIHLPVYEDEVAAAAELEPAPAAPAADRLRFHVDPQGMAQITLDATMPVDQAMLLLRILLDAGFVPRE
jgi:hypothetical protein